MAADAKPNADTIIVPAGMFTLTIPGAGEDNGATGDLDINGNLTLKGQGSNKTIIDGNDLDRVIPGFGRQGVDLGRDDPAWSGERWGRDLERWRPPDSHFGRDPEQRSRWRRRDQRCQWRQRRQ